MDALLMTILPFLLLLACLFLLFMQSKSNGTFSSDSSNKTISVVLPYRRVNQYWGSVLSGINDVISKSSTLRNAALSIRKPDDDTPDVEIPEQVQNLIIQEVLKEPAPIAIICSVPDKRVIESINIANDRNIPVYVIGSGVELLNENTPYEIYVGPNEKNSAQKIAVSVRDLQFDNILILRGNHVNISIDNRFKHLKDQITQEAMKNDAAPIIRDERIDTSMSNATIQEEIKTIVNSNMNVKCIISLDGDITENAILALDERLLLPSNDLNFMKMYSYEYPPLVDEPLFCSVLRDSEYLQGNIIASLIDVRNSSGSKPGQSQKIISRQTIFVDSVLTHPPSVTAAASSPPLPKAELNEQTNT